MHYKRPNKDGNSFFLEMPSETRRDFNEILLDEERHAHQWLRRFVLAAPIATAPLFIIPMWHWLAPSFLANFLLALFCLLAFMTEWSYIRAAFTSPGRVPSTWVQAEGMTYAFPDPDTGHVPENRHCQVCQLPKPPRTSHCKFCEKCVPKMDHHCAWTSNCVGEKNHKYFILFLIYMACLAALFISVTLLRVAAMVYHSETEADPAHMGPGQIMATIFSSILAIPALVGVSSILFSQTYVILNNNTMLERLSAKKLKTLAVSQNNLDWKFVFPYDHGRYSNFVAVFGHNPWLWLLPVPVDTKREHEITNWRINDRYVSPSTLIQGSV